MFLSSESTQNTLQREFLSTSARQVVALLPPSWEFTGLNPHVWVSPGADGSVVNPWGVTSQLSILMCEHLKDSSETLADNKQT